MWNTNSIAQTFHCPLIWLDFTQKTSAAVFLWCMAVPWTQYVRVFLWAGITSWVISFQVSSGGGDEDGVQWLGFRLINLLSCSAVSWVLLSTSHRVIQVLLLILTFNSSTWSIWRSSKRKWPWVLFTKVRLKRKSCYALLPLKSASKTGFEKFWYLRDL